MDIDAAGFELGMPTQEEMRQHQLVLLEHENQQAWQQLAKAYADVRKLVEINEGLNRQVSSLRQQLTVAWSNVSIEASRHRGSFRTWGGYSPETPAPGRAPDIAIYPEL